MSEQTAQPLKYRGQQGRYVDIAVRGANEHLGIGIDYAIHPMTQVGCFIVRFVAHGETSPKSFKHLTYRETGKFLAGDPQHAEVFKGLRLNKVAIPAFLAPVRKHEIDEYATKFGIWPMLTEWIAEQVLAEGFNVTVQLQQIIKELLIVVVPTTDPETVKSVIEFPDLTSPEYKASAMKQMKAPEEDEEDDEDDEDKPWLN